MNFKSINDLNDKEILLALTCEINIAHAENYHIRSLKRVYILINYVSKYHPQRLHNEYTSVSNYIYIYLYELEFENHILLHSAFCCNRTFYNILSNKYRKISITDVRVQVIF